MLCYPRTVNEPMRYPERGFFIPANEGAAATPHSRTTGAKGDYLFVRGDHAPMTFALQHRTILRTLVPVLIIITVTSFNTLSAHAARLVATAADARAEALRQEEILWLARAIYSETKVKEEQLIVAWVIRNRVESEKFGDTYRTVVLSPGQFSGLNAGDPQYRHNLSRVRESGGIAWKNALEVAEAVYNAPSALRPVPVTVWHFYSPNAVSRKPSWAAGLSAIHVIRDPKTEAVRFAFYSSVK